MLSFSGPYFSFCIVAPWCLQINCLFAQIYNKFIDLYLLWISDLSAVFIQYIHGAGGKNCNYLLHMTLKSSLWPLSYLKSEWVIGLFRISFIPVAELLQFSWYIRYWHTLVVLANFTAVILSFADKIRHKMNKYFW